MLSLTPQLLDELKSIDTPTVCNALELVAPDRHGHGFTTRPLVCPRPDLGPMVGFARTARLRATTSPRPEEPTNDVRDGYYAYVDSGPKPAVVVIEDIDTEPGFGSFWGEVNSSIHRGFGCAGVVTNGSIRDLPDIAPEFQLLADRVGPSHAHVRVVDFGGAVTVSGMEVADGHLVHADQHGAVVIPHGVAADIAAAADLIARVERVIIDAARQGGFDAAALLEARRRASEITD